MINKIFNKTQQPNENFLNVRKHGRISSSWKYIVLLTPKETYFHSRFTCEDAVNMTVLNVISPHRQGTPS